MKLKTRLRKKEKELELKVRRENRKYYTECMMDILAEHYVIFPSGDLYYRFVIDGENVKAEGLVEQIGSLGLILTCGTVWRTKI